MIFLLIYIGKMRERMQIIRNAIGAIVLRIFHYLRERDVYFPPVFFFFHNNSQTLLSRRSSVTNSVYDTAAIDDRRYSECFMQIAIVYLDIDAIPGDLFCASLCGVVVAP